MYKTDNFSEVFYYFSEEIFSTADSDKEIIVRDRATLFNMLIGMNGYTICSGIISKELNGPNIIAKPYGERIYTSEGNTSVNIDA